MGIYNRDYARDSPSGSWGQGYSGSTFGGGTSWFVKYLLIANVVVFLANSISKDALIELLQLDFYREAVVTVDIPEHDIKAGTRLRWISNDPLQPSRSIVAHGQQGFSIDGSIIQMSYVKNLQLIWRLVTYGFLHNPDGPQHIVFNMLGLWVFGKMLSRVYSSRELLSFYLGAVIFAGVLHLLYGLATNDVHPAIGASGGVYGLVFLTAVKFSREQILLMFVLPIEMRFVAVLYAVTGIFAAGENVAHMAHLGGALFGLAYGWFGWNLTALAGTLMAGRAFRMPRLRRSNIRIYDPTEQTTGASPEKIDAEIDQILAKINATGEASLTPAERSKLIAESERLKKRRQGS